MRNFTATKLTQLTRTISVIIQIHLH